MAKKATTESTNMALSQVYQCNHGAIDNANILNIDPVP